MNPKPFNGGTWTNSRMFGFIRSALRKTSQRWGPMQEAKKACRRPYRGDNKRRKWEYKCGSCHKWYNGDEVNVHHKVPCGSLTCWEDIGEFCERLFCEKDGFIVLCGDCHAIQHNTKEHNENQM